MSQPDKYPIHILYFIHIQKYLVWDDMGKFTSMSQQDLMYLLSQCFKFQRDLLGLETKLRQLEFLEVHRIGFDLPRKVFFMFKDRMKEPSRDINEYIKRSEDTDLDVSLKFVLDGVPFDLVPYFMSALGKNIFSIS